ncbi:MAG: DUF6786 family protein [Verrucomicrobiota bacterium]
MAGWTLALCACSQQAEQEPKITGESEVMQQTHFAQDLAFLKQHTDIVELRDGSSVVAVAPAYQGRVMTSSYDAVNGPSFGWINRPVIEQGLLPDEERKGTLQEHIYVFGGEERFWLGPEGGQFSIFFKPGLEFDFDEWHTPAPIDTEAFAIASQTETEVVFEHEAEFQNWSGTVLQVGITRTVRLLDREAIEQRLGVALEEGIELVAYETENTIRNLGEVAWTKETGMLSIWILGMYPPAPHTKVVIPFKAGSVDELGPQVNDTYFGKVPPEYLQVEDDLLFFKGDGTYRSKIGISPQRSKGVAGSYDPDSGVLNIVTCSEPKENPGYVNSMWELQEDPFSGDVINSYNDGPAEPGADPLGPFYELETSSPAADLEPGESLTHTQTTIHLKGEAAAIDRISSQILGAGLDEIDSALEK